MIEFYEDTIKILSDMIKGKTIRSISLESGFEDFVIIAFTDGKKLRIRYDYIYEWEII